MQMNNVLQAIEIIGGALYLTAPFTARFRREAPPWVRIAVPLSGLLTEMHVVLTYYSERLHAAHDSRYWRMIGPRSFLGGVISGIILSFFLHYVCDRIAKNRNARTGATEKTPLSSGSLGDS